MGSRIPESNFIYEFLLVYLKRTREDTVTNSEIEAQLLVASYERCKESKLRALNRIRHSFGLPPLRRSASSVNVERIRSLFLRRKAKNPS
jgi:hypothetical protein